NEPVPPVTRICVGSALTAPSSPRAAERGTRRASREQVRCQAVGARSAARAPGAAAGRFIPSGCFRLECRRSGPATHEARRLALAAAQAPAPRAARAQARELVRHRGERLARGGLERGAGGALPAG